jgi:putative transposase
MDQRVAFIAEWLRDEWTMTELAERYQISRKTAYKWADRYAADPAAGLGDRSRAPKAHGRALAEPIRDAILALREAHPHWGPKKLRAILKARQPQDAWPAASTMGDLLRRAGVSQPRRRTRYIVPLTQPLAAAQAPNDVWTADFKGWFRTADQTRCDPLTLADACSRFVFCCRIVAPSEQGVRPWFERAFREHGLPVAMRTDNGSPFATTGAGQLSHLAVWWLKLGIQLDRIDPGHPEQNGRHERFHLTLQQETTTPPAATPRSSNGALIACVSSSIPSGRMKRSDTARRRASLYAVAPGLSRAARGSVVRRDAPGPARPRPWPDQVARRVRLRQRSRPRRAGGAGETERGDWLVHFMRVELGRIDRQTRRFTPAWHRRRRAVRSSRRTP